MENCLWTKIKRLSYKVERTDIVVLILVEIDSFKSKCTCHRPDLSNNFEIKVHKIAQSLELVSKELNHFWGIASFFRDWAPVTLTGGK